MCRKNEQVFEIDTVAGKPCRVVVKKDREADRGFAFPSDDALRLRLCAKQRCLKACLGRVAVGEGALILSKGADELQDGRHVGRGRWCDAKHAAINAPAGWASTSLQVRPPAPTLVKDTSAPAYALACY